MKNMIVASTSTLHGGKYLDYLEDSLKILFSETEEILFIPYARPSGISHDTYTEKAAEAFKGFGKKLVGIHTFEDPQSALKTAKGIFVGGGNTFLLVKELYKFDLMQTLREVIFKGIPYLGTSAGSNICGTTMQNTNDMPIVYPPSFKTTGALPFNINAHYLDPDANSKHMGETRETRITEFHTQNTIPVIGLREGSFIEVKDEKYLLKGNLEARIFLQGKEPFEVKPKTNLIDVSE